MFPSVDFPVAISFKYVETGQDGIAARATGRRGASATQIAEWVAMLHEALIASRKACFDRRQTSEHNFWVV